MFYDSIESQGSLSKSDINSYTKTYGTAVEKAGYDYLDKYTDAVEQLAKIKNSDTTIEDAENKVEKLGIELEQLKISLQKANNELEIAKTQQVLDSAELDKKIQDAKIDLQKAKEGNAQEQEIDSIRNEIDNIQFSISTYLKKYDEYKIIANFDGVVTKLDMQV
jgi:multidrug resistance efflux pump